jgi:hypothetical protein
MYENYTGCFIILFAITNIYNKKTKRPTSMELFTATGKLKKFFLFNCNYRCLMCAPRVLRHTSIRYSSSCHTRVNMGASIFSTAAMNRAFRSARSRGNGGTNTRSLTYPQRKKSQGVMQGDLWSHSINGWSFQTHALSNVLVLDDMRW